MSTADLQAELNARKSAEKAEADKQLRQYEADRELFIQEMVLHFEELSSRLKALKKRAVETASDLQERSYTVLGRKRKDKEVDQFTLLSKDGKLKLVMDRQYRGEYDETGLVAIGTIREVMREKFEGRNKTLYIIVDSILMKNRKGDYDERLVSKLSKHEQDVNDPRFSEALAQLRRAYRTTTSQTYIRVYRQNEAGRWEDISVAFSAM